MTSRLVNPRHLQDRDAAGRRVRNQPGANRLLFALLLAFLSPASWCAPADYSPAVGRDYPVQVFWGDTHLHTSWSNDANLMGNLNVTPEQAYRFARGETVTASNGMQAALSRPLDFLVVADHAEYLGVLPALRSGQQLPTKELNDIGRMLAAGGDESKKAMKIVLDAFGHGILLPGAEQVQRSTWNAQVQMADKFNEPGRFTALPGFEWTSMPDGNNLHRVVVFREGVGKSDQVAAFSLYDSDNPEDLWQWMADYEAKTEGEVLAIPHNGNLSNGLMFSDRDFAGNPLNAGEARTRARWEPIMEVTQIKGDAETHPYLSPDDEFADYGTFDAGNLDGSVAKQKDMLQYEYARSALKWGLSLQQKTGVNPFKYGMIGSTDSHTGLATADEDNFWGKSVIYEPGREHRIKGTFLKITESTKGMGVPSSAQLASGYAAVWAKENTRDSLFDAMRRREVYATTGPRITVRFFGGWNYPSDAVERPDYVDVGYGGGVPMGADLPAASGPGSPRFIVSALKDPDGANLDRVQIVKGWLDASGDQHEKVYDVAWSGGRKPDGQGKVPPVGNTVDVEKATYRNSIGAVQLASVWIDPEFDPAQRAFYYVRVLEIPTPRWVTYDRLRLGAELPADTELVHQERAYTSPIWFNPSAD